MTSIPLTALASPFPLSSQRTIAFMESAEREETLWTHVFEKYKGPCRIKLVKSHRATAWDKFKFWWTSRHSAPKRKDRRELWKESCLIAADTLESPDFENGRDHDWIKPADRDVWMRLVSGMDEKEIAAEDSRTACSVSRAKKRVIKWILREAERIYRDLMR